MEKTSAIRLAKIKVRQVYNCEPPVAMVFPLLPEVLESLDEIQRGELSKFFGQSKVYKSGWIVLFRCSWDTDEMGLPSTLGAFVGETSEEILLF